MKCRGKDNRFVMKGIVLSNFHEYFYVNFTFQMFSIHQLSEFWGKQTLVVIQIFVMGLYSHRECGPIHCQCHSPAGQGQLSQDHHLTWLVQYIISRFWKSMCKTEEVCTYI